MGAGAEVRTLGAYGIVRELGRGAMGAVHEAVDTRTGEAVALKVLWDFLAPDASVRARFAQEVEVLRRLSHPGLVAARSPLEEDEGKIFFAMELVRGRSLADLLRARGSLPPAAAIDVTGQLLDGLAAAHDAGIVHRDLKPSNLLLAREGSGVRVKIADFGIAQAADITKLTMTGQIVGTPHYMSPEQCNGERGDASCDLYAAGVLLFEMLEGHPPFRGQSPFAVMKGHLDASVPPLAAVPPEERGALETALARAMAKAPAERFSSARQMRSSLPATSAAPGWDLLWLGDETVLPAAAEREGASPVRPALREAAAPGREGGKRPGRRAAWAAACLASGAAAWILLNGAPPEPPPPGGTPGGATAPPILASSPVRVRIVTPTALVEGDLVRIDEREIVVRDILGRAYSVPLSGEVEIVHLPASVPDPGR